MFSLTVALPTAKIRNKLFIIETQLFRWVCWFYRRWTTVLKIFRKSLLSFVSKVFVVFYYPPPPLKTQNKSKINIWNKNNHQNTDTISFEAPNTPCFDNKINTKSNNGSMPRKSNNRPKRDPDIFEEKSSSCSNFDVDRFFDFDNLA